MEREDQWIDGLLAKADLDLCNNKAYQAKSPAVTLVLYRA
jgi:hypothetical protein